MGTIALALLGAVLSACVGTAAPSMPPLDAAARAVMEGTTQQALEENPDGQGSTWSMAETGHAGTVIPLRTFLTPSGQACRDFQQTVSAGGTTRIADGTACRRTEGGWQLIAYSGLDDGRGPYGYGRPHVGYGPYGGYAPYYPGAAVGVFYGIGKGHSHYGHGHGHYRKHHYKEHHYKKRGDKKHRVKKDHRRKEQRHVHRQDREHKRVQKREGHRGYDGYRQQRPEEGHRGQWQKSRDR